MKLLLSQHKFCVHPTTMHQFTASLFEAVCRVCVCSAVTSHLHYGQNDWDLLRAAAVTRGWNRYRNKSQRRQLSMEKQILCLLLPGLKPETFRLQVSHSTTELSPLPEHVISLTRSWLDVMWMTRSWLDVIWMTRSWLDVWCGWQDHGWICDVDNQTVARCVMWLTESQMDL